jgi:hypothetical protein
MSNFNIVKKVYQQMASEKGCGCKKKKFAEGEMENPCEPGYVAYGTKEKDGRTVPNCIPDPEEMKKIIKDGFPIPSPSAGESESDYMGRCISEISGEYEHDQSIAICIGKWNEK